METDDNRLLTAAELGERLRVDPNTVRRWARAGLIPVVRLPRFGMRFEYHAVRAALVAQTQKGVARACKPY